jgi:transcriptional regulator with XRE-family HTH domain
MMTLLSKLRERFKQSFEYRHTYVESFVDSYIATQIKVLREQLKLTQSGLAERARMRQSQISALEDVNNSSWTVSTLKKLARAFDMVLVVKFESFGHVLPDIDRFNRSSLQRKSFEDDPVFVDDTRYQSDSTENTTALQVSTSTAKILRFKPRGTEGIALASKTTQHEYFSQASAH